MSSRDLISARLERIQETLSLQLPPGDTVRPETRGGGGARAAAALAADGHTLPPEQRVAMHDVLGMGGMGVVHRGTQAALGREVAVKAVRPDKRTRDSTAKLLQEAFIAGTLEHPNIVPVYDIGVGGEGQPLIVQQRVEGLAWSDLVGDPAEVQRRFQTDDVLEWNLRVLMQVCNAVHFTHARGVLHLDIKPSNIMVGAFGEVFLLDWGLAMTLRDDGRGRLPLASENQDVIGTPAFIAPEMLAQGDPPLSERTDIYLLGATLYRICAGRPPHQGTTALATLFAAATRAPDPLTEVPDELARICGKAMAFEAEERFSTAEELRVALQGFLQHRGAVQLAEEASRKVAELETRWASGESGAEDESSQVHALFSAARFGLEQARSIWAEVPRVGDNLRRLRVGMARWELAQGHARAAHTLLVDVEDPPADLVAEIDAEIARLAALDARVGKLQAYRDERDWRVGAATRAGVIGAIGLTFVVLPVIRALSDGPEAENWVLPIGEPVGFLAIFTVLAVAARRTLMGSSVNRNTVA
ncbi:MAG: serine/threonine protein kinase, partial [Deltaproteobacteria bacterium]|nr:serine/threonine protein kinase [Deltaproteobacteria bacterium]